MKDMSYNTLDRVRRALAKSGYDSEGIYTAKFIGWNDSDSEVHAITFDNDDDRGGVGIGQVYIDKEGKGEF